MNCLYHINRSPASHYRSPYLLLFLKSWRSFIRLFHTHFTSVISPSVASGRRQFILRICLAKDIVYKRLFSTISSRISSLVVFSDHFIFSILLQQHILNLPKYLIATRSVSYTVQCSKYNIWPISPESSVWLVCQERYFFYWMLLCHVTSRLDFTYTMTISL